MLRTNEALVCVVNLIICELTGIAHITIAPQRRTEHMLVSMLVSSHHAAVARLLPYAT